MGNYKISRTWKKRTVQIKVKKTREDIHQNCLFENIVKLFPSNGMTSHNCGIYSGARRGQIVFEKERRFGFVNENELLVYSMKLTLHVSF